MFTASLNSENISIFAFLCSREKFPAQSKGLFSPKQTQNVPKNSCTSDFYKSLIKLLAK
jgi:adenosine deaminase